MGTTACRSARWAHRVGDGAQSAALGALGGDPGGDRAGEGAGAPEAYALGALGREPVAGALADEAALVLRDDRGHPGDHLAGRRRGVDVDVERDDRPALTARGLHEPGEVEHRA